jgi:hypothetical protein
LLIEPPPAAGDRGHVLGSRQTREGKPHNNQARLWLKLDITSGTTDKTGGLRRVVSPMSQRDDMGLAVP